MRRLYIALWVLYTAPASFFGDPDLAVIKAVRKLDSTVED